MLGNLNLFVKNVRYGIRNYV